MSIKKTKSSLGYYWEIFKQSISKFIEDDIFTHAAALSYYTIFSLPPMILIILFTTGLFYDKETIKASLFEQIGSLVGKGGAEQLLFTIEKFNVFEPTLWATALGFGVMAFTSTTVFITMQNALNIIFKVKPTATGYAIIKLVKDRILSFTLLIGVGFILMVSLVVNTLVAEFGKYLEGQFGYASYVLNFMTNILLPFFINTLLFAMIFKFLPDAKLRWKDTWFGAILTSVLFVIGKYLISFYIGTSDVSGLYDAAGSIMVIMVWVFYASLIVMFGSVVTYCRMKINGDRIKASDFAEKA